MPENFEANLKLLEKQGDPLECLIMQTSHGSEDFGQILYQYASVWANHIFPRRLENNSARVPEDWMRFAGSHYTALFRAYSALRKLPEIKRICEEFVEKKFDDEALFQIHDVTACFWWNLGASIDNLLRAADDAPPLRKRSIKRDEHPELIDAYNYRSQHIHSRLVVGAPDSDGLLHFNVELLKGHGADWKINKYIPEYYEDFYPSEWKKFASSASQAWAKLRSLLLEHDDDRPVKSVEDCLLIEPRGPLNFGDFSQISNVTFNSYPPQHFFLPPSGTQ